MTHRELVIREWFVGIYNCMQVCKGHIAPALAACMATQMFEAVEPVEKRCIFLVAILEKMKEGGTPERIFREFMRKEESNHIWTPN